MMMMMMMQYQQTTPVSRRISVLMAVILLLSTTTTTVVQALTINQVTAKAKRPITYYIDGNNFLGQRGLHGLPRNGDGDALATKLQPMSTAIKDSDKANVVLVFDGRKEIDVEEKQTSLGGINHNEDSFIKINLESGRIADDYILDQIHTIKENDPNRRVKLVTADKQLRKLALAIRPTCKEVINPKIFWKKYVPRMSGYKKNPTPHQPRDSDNENDNGNENE